MIGLKLRPVSWKMWQFHLNMNIEIKLWRHAVTWSVTQSTLKILFGDSFGRSFHIWCQNEPMQNILKISKWPPFWGQSDFYAGSCTGIWVIQQDRPCYSPDFEFLIDAVTQILTTLWQFQKLSYFSSSWQTYLTFDLETLQTSVLSHDTSVGDK